MRNISGFAALLLVGFTTSAAADDIPAIDCGKASAPDEKTICASADLRVLDAETSTLYQIRMSMPMLMGERGNAHDAQVAFLKERSGCGSDTSCIASAYQGRISALQGTIASGMEEFCKLKGIC